MVQGVALTMAQGVTLFQIVGNRAHVQTVLFTLDYTAMVGRQIGHRRNIDESSCDESSL